MKEFPDLDDWVSEGLISAEQAEAIRLHERSAAPPPAPGRVSLATEAVGYLGGGLVATAAVLLLAEIWADLSPGARVAFVGAVTGVLAVAGALIRNIPEPAIQRLASFLWFLSSGGAAFLFGLVASDVVGTEGRVTFLVASVAAALYSLGLWLERRQALQELALFAGVVATVIAVMIQPEDPPDAFFVGLAIWGAGLVWAVLAWAGAVTPRTWGNALGALAMLGGAQFATVEELTVWGLWLGVATALGLLLAGIVAQEAYLLAPGALGIIVFVPQLVLHLFEDTLGAPLALLITGLALIIGAVVFVRTRGRPRRGPRISTS